MYEIKTAVSSGPQQFTALGYGVRAKLHFQSRDAFVREEISRALETLDLKAFDIEFPEIDMRDLMLRRVFVEGSELNRPLGVATGLGP